MAAPTITSVTPTTGPTGGRRLVKIVGTGFQLPPVPPATGPATVAPKPSVQVFFGGEPALEVAVMSPTLLHVYTAPHDPGRVDVTVRNVDQTGALVGAETVTVPDAYTFERPVLTTGRSGEQDMTRLVRTLLRELKRQLLPNVKMGVHTDYVEDTTAQVAHFAKLPGLMLVGPVLRENRFYSENGARRAVAGGGKVAELRPAYTVDLGFTLIGVDDNELTFLNLMAETLQFFNRNKVLRMPATNGGTDMVEYELEVDPDGEPRQTGTPNNSNTRAFQAAFTIRGFDVDEADMTRREVGVLQDAPAADVDGSVWPVYLGGTVGPDGTAVLGATRTEQKDEE